MVNEEFKKNQVTISREEYGRIVAGALAELISAMPDDIEPELGAMIIEAFTRFSADIMYHVFGEDTIEVAENE